MNAESERDHLVVLTADRDAEQALRELFRRQTALGLREIEPAFHTHDNRDNGCFAHCHEYLRPFLRTHRHALVVFDRHGCGREHQRSREAIERDVEERLRTNGWGDRAAAIAIDPELEAWVWIDPPTLTRVIKWPDSQRDLWAWLRREKWLRARQPKPRRPKEAFLAALRVARKKRSAAVYGDLARELDFRACTDSAFSKLVSQLQLWFPGQG